VTDVVVIGGGHNSLVCALGLARAGKRVTVVERREAVGGLAAPLRFGDAGTYTVPGLLHETGGVRPALVRDLGLDRAGLVLEPAPGPVLATSGLDRGVMLWPDAQRSAADLSRLDPGAAAGYATYRAFHARVRDFVAGVLDEPPPSISPTSFAELLALGKAGLGLRGLGKADMVELLRVAPMCAADWLVEHFSAVPLLSAALAAPAVQGTWYGPWSAGTAANLLMHECTRTAHLPGGPAALVAALARALEATGRVEIRTGSAVAEILVDSAGVRGVRLEQGGEILAPLVASGLDPRTTLLSLVPPLALSTDVARQLEVVRARGTSAKVHLALAAPLVFRERPGERLARAQVGGHLDDLERAADAVKYRAMSDRPHLDVWVPTVADPSLAPAGHEVVSLLVHYAPHDLAGGWTDEARQTLADRALAVLEAAAPGVRSQIVAMEVLTPVDIEHRYGISGGHIHHVEHALDQILFMRPAPAVAHYRTPVRGLYLCGAGCHPGGGLSGMPGALAAKTILKGAQMAATLAGTPGTR